MLCNRWVTCLTESKIMVAFQRLQIVFQPEKFWQPGIFLGSWLLSTSLGNTALDLDTVQGRVEILQVTLCYRNEISSRAWWTTDLVCKLCDLLHVVTKSCGSIHVSWSMSILYFRQTKKILMMKGKFNHWMCILLKWVFGRCTVAEAAGYRTHYRPLFWHSKIVISSALFRLSFWSWLARKGIEVKDWS